MEDYYLVFTLIYYFLIVFLVVHHLSSEKEYIETYDKGQIIKFSFMWPLILFFILMASPFFFIDWIYERNRKKLNKRNPS